MKFVVVGCGRVGARLANLLDAEGHEVTVVDINPEAFARLGREFTGSVIVGTGVDEDVLRRAGIETAHGLAAVTNDDNANIMASQVAKIIFNVPRVTTRIYDPAREDIFRALGLNTISPIRIGALRLKEVLESEEPSRTCL